MMRATVSADMSPPDPERRFKRVPHDAFGHLLLEHFTGSSHENAHLKAVQLEADPPEGYRWHRTKLQRAQRGARVSGTAYYRPV